MKKLVLSALITTLFAVPALAETSSNFTDANLVFGLPDEQLAQVEMLSTEEMQATEGAVLPFTVALALGLRFTANPLIRHYGSSFALAYGTYRGARDNHPIVRRH